MTNSDGANFLGLVKLSEIGTGFFCGQYDGVAVFPNYAFPSCSHCGMCLAILVLEYMVSPIGNIWNISSYTKEIANAIDKAFRVSPSQKKKMLSNNRQHLLERFSADSMAENYYRLLCRLTMG